MRRLLFLLTSAFALSACSGSPDTANLVITNSDLTDKLSSFIKFEQDHFLHNDRNELTVSIYKNEEGRIGVRIWNGIPLSCDEEVVGFSLFQDQKVYFKLYEIDDQGLFEVEEEFQCDLPDRRPKGKPGFPPPPPRNVHYAEEYFVLIEGELVPILDAPAINPHPMVEEIDILQVDFYSTVIVSISCEEFPSFAGDFSVRRKLKNQSEIDDFMSMLAKVEKADESNSLDVKAQVLVKFRNGSVDEYCVDMFHAIKNGNPVVIPNQMRTYLKEMSE